MLEYLVASRDVIPRMFQHLYLSSCVTDLIVRFCSVPDIKEMRPSAYNGLRGEAVQHIINSLDHFSDDDFITEQLFDILCGVTRKCYIMYNPKEFFDTLMSPFLFLPLLEFTFEGGAHTKQGADFFKLFFYNLFLAQPEEAIIDLMECNFGF